VKLRIMK